MAKVYVAVAGLALVSGSALAVEPTFENHLTSTTMVSPAQLYQIQDMKTDFALGFTSETGSDKPTGAKEMTNTEKGTDVFAAAVYNVKDLGLRAGLIVNYGSSNTEEESLDPTATSTTKTKTDGTDMVVSPQVAYTVGPVVVGAAYDLTQRSAKVEDMDEQKATFGTFRPGVVFTTSDMEAGLTYSSATNRAAKDTKDLDVREAATVTAHGRYALDRQLAVGAILGNVHYAGLNKDAFEDRQTVKGTVEYAMGALKTEGDIGYNTAFYKKKEFMTERNIGTIGLGAGADYEVSKAATVGGALGYEFGSDKNDAGKYAQNTLSLAVRGDMKF